MATIHTSTDGPAPTFYFHDDPQGLSHTYPTSSARRLPTPPLPNPEFTTALQEGPRIVSRVQLDLKLVCVTPSLTGGNYRLDCGRSAETKALPRQLPKPAAATSVPQCAIASCRCSDVLHALPSARDCPKVAQVTEYAARRKAELARQGEYTKLADVERQATRRIEQEQKAKRKRAAKEQRARKRAKSELNALNILIARGSAGLERNVALRDKLVRQLASADASADADCDSASAEDSQSES